MYKDIHKKDYHKPSLFEWVGRNDINNGRLFQRIQLLDCLHLPDSLPPNSIVFLGFACDEGVRRNLGREGAAEGPESLRKALCNIPLSGAGKEKIFWDAGDVLCVDQNLETSQHVLGEIIAELRQRGAQVIVLGGGHEVSFGHFQGLIQPEGLDVINFDAHFDLRPLLSESEIGPLAKWSDEQSEEGKFGSSGTGFRQMSEYCKEKNIPWRYACLGVQPFGNTAALFDYAATINTCFCLADTMVQEPEKVHDALSHWLKSANRIYLTLCLDVFSQADAPGVSAPQPLGLSPHALLPFFRHILQSGKVIGFDVAELNPIHDRDNQTARLAAYFIAECIQYL